MGLIKFTDRIGAFIWRSGKSIFWDSGTPSQRSFISLVDSFKSSDSISRAGKNLSLSDAPKGKDVLKSIRASLIIKDGSGKAI